MGLMKNTEKVLRNSQFFLSLKNEDISKIAPHFKLVSFSRGDVILHEDEIADRFFVIVEGSVEVWKNHATENSARLAVKSRGNIFGEMALIDDEPRSATIVATEDCKVLQVHKSDFYKLSETHPVIIFAVLRALSRAIRQSNDSFVASLSKQNQELQQALENLKSTQKELIRAERFSNLGKLSSLIIHDLRNPLSVIKGYGEMLQILYDESDEVQEFSRKIIQEALRLNRFAQELLDYSRGDVRLVWVFTSFPMIFQKLKQYLGAGFSSEGMELKLECDCTKPFYADEERLLRAMLNLCNNARKAMDRGGTLEIRETCTNEELVVLIKDDGHGMDADVLSHIFEPFYSSSHRGGTGLGMTSVKTIIEAHGGSVNIESEPGKGTSVTLVIPRNEELPE